MSTKLSIRRLWRSCLPSGAVFLLCGALAAAASAAPAEGESWIAGLIERGQLSEAMKQVDDLLLANPAHPQMRFTKGVILARQGKTAEAITLLLKLAEDHPGLSEPYNNLAALYAATGQYENARIALNKAVANNPDHGMAYENLGDVHAELASQAYAKAARLDGGGKARAKLAALRGHMQSAPAVARPVAGPASGALAMADHRAAASSPNPGKKTGSQKSASESAADIRHAAVLDAVNVWAQAWSARDVKAYLAAYSSDFVTPRGMSRGRWVAERTERISNKQRIAVQVETPRVTFNGDQATVQFRQQFSSDRLRLTGRKTLVLTLRNGTWRIREEQVGEPPAARRGTARLP